MKRDLDFSFGRKIGFQVDRQRGSHIVMSKGNVILVIPDHETVAKGTERELIKEQRR